MGIIPRRVKEQALSRQTVPNGNYFQNEKREGNYSSFVQRGEPLLDNIPVPQHNFWICCTDRTDIIFRQILKFCSRFNTMVGFTAFLIIDVIAHGTDIACRPPFFKSPLANLAFSLESTDGTEIRFREIFKRGACRNAIMRLTPKG